jgi:hypothetical protein
MAQRDQPRPRREFCSLQQPLLPSPLPPPLCHVILGTLIPTDLASFAPKVLVGVDNAGFAAITREVYWFVIARKLAPAVLHYCQANGLPPISPSQFTDITNADLLIKILTFSSSRWYEGPSSPQIYDIKCAVEMASLPWNASRVGFFVALSAPYRCMDIGQSVANLLVRIKCHLRVI